MKCWETEAQSKNIAWLLPRPKPDHYKGGMPLYAEEWLLALAKDILNNPDAKILNMFSGACTQGLRVDINSDANPDILCDCHKLPLRNDQFDVVLADPPYSNEESDTLYKTGKLNYKKWSAEADRVLKIGGLLVVYHKYLMPNPNPEKYSVKKRVFLGTRTYHLGRIAVYFKKK